MKITQKHASVMPKNTKKTKTKCKVEGCETTALKKGYCQRHYMQLFRGNLLTIFPLFLLKRQKMKNLAYLALFPLVMILCTTLTVLAKTLNEPSLFLLAKEIGKGNSDIIYCGMSFIAVFQYRKWWLLPRWSLFFEDFRDRAWTDKYNQWPKKTKRQGGGNAMP